MNKKVIFIGGCSRSGTTLLADRLGSGPGIVVTPESQFKAKAFQIYTNSGLEAAISYIATDFRFLIWKVDITKIDFSEVVSFSDLMFLLVNAYAETLEIDSWSAWVDHTPSNLREYQHLTQAFPASKFVHLLRDGRGVFSSMKNLDWGRHNPVHAAEYWIAGIAPGIALVASGRAFQVKYEKLVAGDIESFKFLCKYVGIGFVDSMLTGGGFKLPGYTRRQHRLVGQKLDSSRAEAWESGLARRECEIFEYYAGSVLVALGYGLLNEFPLPATRVERLFMGDWPVKSNWHLFRRLKVWIRRRRALLDAIQ